MKKYTQKQIKELKLNPYTFEVNDKRLYFTVEFKKIFWTKYQAGISPRAIIKELGYDLSYFTQGQIDNLVQHLRKKSLAGEEFSEGYCREKRPGIKVPNEEISDQTIQQMRSELLYLRQEVDFLKKVLKKETEP